MKSSLSSSIEKFVSIIAQLRDPERGCPWDVKQTPKTLQGSLLEEAYEVLDAVIEGSHVNLCEELGDLLLHIVMIAQMASENGEFTFEDVINGITEKIIRRHPHVFDVEDAAQSNLKEHEVRHQWEEIKKQEKKDKAAANSTPPPTSLLADIPKAFPALMRAQKVQKIAARAKFDWNTAQEVIAKIEEEVEEIKAELADPAKTVALGEEIGDLLFAAVNLARWKKFNAELLLQQATEKFIQRFQKIETQLQNQDITWNDVSTENLNALWDEVKKQEQETL